MLNRLISFLLDATESIVVSLSIFVVIYLFLASPTEVLGYSMEPNLKPNQKLVVEKVTGRFGEYKRNDIVVINSPAAPSSASGRQRI